MSNDDATNNGSDAQAPFPTDEELLAAGYVPIDFSNMPDVSNLVTDQGHPFPRHEEIIKAGYVPISRRERRIVSRPRLGQMYWIAFTHDASAPEFLTAPPGLLIPQAPPLPAP